MTGAPLYAPQWRLALDALTAVVRDGRAADRLLQRAFRDQPQMGGRDRRRVNDLLYGVLRDLRRLRRIAGSDVPADWLALHALESGLTDAAGLHQLGVERAAVLAAALRGFDDARLTPAERGNVPDAIHAQWQAQLGAVETLQLAEALRAQASVDLRVNTLKCTRAQALAALRSAGFEAEPTPLAPHGLRLRKRAALQALPAFRDGWFEPQDEGSQLLALLVAARPGERIVDWCAGAGGKTLALAAQMENRGALLALDADARRLRDLPPRLVRAGVRCVTVQTLDAAEASRHEAAAARGAATFDAVLVDAPCSGSGTWRRQPEARLKPLDLAALAATQRQILDRAATWVRPGGRLVYATCSLLRAENEAVVEAFLATHADFELQDAGALLRTSGVELPGHYLQLYPHRHGTDGFFGAGLRRR
ncbi:RsmB/NOP family class I SAM-dependent RNA methyltransferase [Fontimonas sp. SYSU GA230001]|uniref:RsmB/NOP family class I SAM-dependent RNA methyltransferase n=1 Tax=Fontimonas sp. SYSU GA230001 TaxID=3142450 RepID=UPI0032B336B8